MPVDENLPALVADALSEYRTITSIPVQWGDMDAFGHVNNVVYIQWFESARIDLLNTMSTSVSMKAGGIAPILASIKCDYKKQLHFPDTVHIGSRIGKVGRTSVEIEHAIYSQQLEQVAAVGASVMVVFDYASNRPVRVPEELKEQL